MRGLFLLLGRVFGMFWLVFGINGLFHLFPTPPAPEQSAYFMDALEKAGYVMPLVYGLEIVGGLMLLLGQWTALALLLLGPITLNIILYDAMLNPGGLVIGLIIAVIHALLLWRNRAAYLPLIAN